MEEVKNMFLENKKKILLASGIILLLLAALFVFYLIQNKYTKEETLEMSDGLIAVEENAVSEVSKETEPTIKVDVKGMVQNPGVYELSSGSRVIEAITMAGGFLEGAYTRYINLSQILVDENVIIVNSESEIDVIKKGENLSAICENTNEICVSSENTVTNNVNKESSNKSNTTAEEKTMSNTLVNINEATLEEFLTLSGIGESKAKNIIDYREQNGNFKSIEDIKNVKGIGDSIYAKIKENITV